jgi:hypothetical protein
MLQPQRAVQLALQWELSVAQHLCLPSVCGHTGATGKPRQSSISPHRQAGTTLRPAHKILNIDKYADNTNAAKSLALPAFGPL